MEAAVELGGEEGGLLIGVARWWSGGGRWGGRRAARGALMVSTAFACRGAACGDEDDKTAQLR